MSWRTAAYRAARPLLFSLDPERVHDIALGALGSRVGRAMAPFASGAGPTDGRTVELMGLRFRNRIGLGAGFDKDGMAIAGWASIGFGFLELGTVTPRPQAGNPRPRLYRLPADGGLVNRMGFNNAGADALAARIAGARSRLPSGFVIGVNIGRNRDTPDERATEDYVAAARSVADAADYLAVNVSSPNTPGLRDLQDPSRLIELVGAVRAAAPRPPILVKLSPDLDDARLEDLVRALATSPAAGVILGNTTTARAGLRSGHAAEPGGLSGRPLLERTLRMIGTCRSVARTGFVIVASGGIGSSEAVARVLDEGADLSQLWTGLIYSGPGLIGQAIRASAD